MRYSDEAEKMKNTESAHRLNFSNPTILDLKNTTFSSDYAVIPENYDKGYVYLVITEQSLPDFPSKIDAVQFHPMHLHGHDVRLNSQNAFLRDDKLTCSAVCYSGPEHGPL